MKKTLLLWLVSLFAAAASAGAADDLRSLQEKMADIRAVNRAKWLLISQLGMSEPEAHRYLEKQAMDQCVSKRELAESIIKTYS